MESNYIPLNFSDSNISSQIAQFIANNPDISNQLDKWQSGVVDQPTYFSDSDVWQNCTPLVDAVTQLCPWETIDHLCIVLFRPGVNFIHQEKTTYDSYKILDKISQFEIVFPVQNWERDQCHVAFYDPLPEAQWTVSSLEEIGNTIPTILFTTDSFWADTTSKYGAVQFSENQVVEIDRVSTVDPYQPFLRNMESICSIRTADKNVPAPFWLSVRSTVDLVEQYNLIPK